MTISTKNLRAYLQEFDFKRLFVEELGWNNYTSRLPPFELEGIRYTFTPIAEQGSMIVAQCESSDGNIPSTGARRKIDRYITELAFEHILIFVDKDRLTSLWQWAKHEDGKTYLPKHNYRVGQHADSLLQKLSGIAFDIRELDEYDSKIPVPVVKGKVSKSFDIEEVTRSFFGEFKDEHDAFLALLTDIQDEQIRRWYTSIMLNRLMFLYFIQKKGFLDNDPEYLQTKLTQMQSEGRNYYQDFLLVLFFEGLSCEEDERSETVNQLLGSIRYLNGGLFLPHPIEEEHTDQKLGDRIEIPNEAFERLYGFFSHYNWHLDVRIQRPGNEINPDVLGYIFEKYINQKEMGAYYTKEDITEYICKNTILPFLLDKAGVDVKAVMRDVEPYIYDAVSTTSYLPTETEREYLTRRKRYEQIKADFAGGKIVSINDLVTYNLDIIAFVEDWLHGLDDPSALGDFYFNFLTKLTVLDPTCGSGAFLFAAMNILEPLYELSLDKMRRFADPVRHLAFVDELKRVDSHPNRSYFVFKSIIVNNLYGVDIMEEAVEICKLRLFLKLVAQIEEVKQIEPLPDIDFNMRAGNTLVGFATQSEIAGRLFATDELKRKVREADKDLNNFRQLQTRLGVGAQIFKNAKKAIERQLDSIRDDLDHSLMEDYGQSDLIAFRKSHQPFHWYVEFNHVMANGGFDVIVGNPPYVEIRNLEGYSLKNYVTVKTRNLYSIVLERCMLIGKNNSLQGYIVPVSSISTDGYSELQKLLKRRSFYYSSYDDRPSHLFDGLDKNTLSILLLFSTTPNPKYYATRLNRWGSQERESLFALLNYVEPTQRGFVSSMPKVSSLIEASILEKIWTKFPLAKYLTPTGQHKTYYSRKVNSFLQILDFVPRVTDGKGNIRPPSEFKTLRFKSQFYAAVAMCCMNSTLFRWFLDVYTDGSHLNKREVEGFPIDLEELSLSDDQARWLELSTKLTKNLQDTSEVRVMRYQHDTLSVQCIIPKHSKSIIDAIDRMLARHYGFTNEELDFIINYDIKYRMGKDAEDEAHADE